MEPEQGVKSRAQRPAPSSPHPSQELCSWESVGQSQYKGMTHLTKDGDRLRTVRDVGPWLGLAFLRMVPVQRGLDCGEVENSPAAPFLWHGLMASGE